MTSAFASDLKSAHILRVIEKVLWGTMAGIFNFIPYAGATMTLIVLTTVAFVSFDGLGHVLGFLALWFGGPLLKFLGPHAQD